MRIAMLAGGTGGAKLAAGMQELVGADLAVVANTADDVCIHGLHVSPDPDLITYWLADEIDEERGWGIRGDSFTVHERLERLGAPGWFQLSDRDLATCLYRTHFRAEGGSLTAAQGQIARALGVRASVLPMCEEDVYTRVLTPGGWRGLQEYLIAERSAPAIEGVEVQGLDQAAPTPEVREALAGADAIVVGPSLARDDDHALDQHRPRRRGEDVLQHRFDECGAPGAIEPLEQPLLRGAEALHRNDRGGAHHSSEKLGELEHPLGQLPPSRGSLHQRRAGEDSDVLGSWVGIVGVDDHGPDHSHEEGRDPCRRRGTPDGGHELLGRSLDRPASDEGADGDHGSVGRRDRIAHP
ncbi:MAG TPA: 2-phospho-L-lactate transferase CofD family protein, partial [Candidatus Acidoferrum sp.]|nr:2-phospho-L-lactate transferase CofD family protein [Candidatus Acidoferrum sp.]